MSSFGTPGNSHEPDTNIEQDQVGIESPGKHAGPVITRRGLILSATAGLLIGCEREPSRYELEKEREEIAQAEKERIKNIYEHLEKGGSVIYSKYKDDIDGRDIVRLSRDSVHFFNQTRIKGGEILDNNQFHRISNFTIIDDEIIGEVQAMRAKYQKYRTLYEQGGKFRNGDFLFNEDDTLLVDIDGVPVLFIKKDGLNNFLFDKGNGVDIEGKVPWRSSSSFNLYNKEGWPEDAFLLAYRGGNRLGSISEGDLYKIEFKTYDAYKAGKRVTDTTGVILTEMEFFED